MKNSNRLFLDIHVIQTVPPSNINRDDTGSPKMAQYGGVRRARVSSQSWKKAMRDYFRLNGEDACVGVRTLQIVRYVADKIEEINGNLSQEDALKLAEDTINKLGIKTTKDHTVKALFFMGDKQAHALARAAIDGISDKKQLQQLISDNPDIDVALFGRMVADDPSLNEDASAQVAHAISTHAVQTEFDYFTAIDDLSPEDNARAKMIGTIEYNSSTLYRYANVAIHEFSKQVNDIEIVKKSIKLFVEAFVNSMPTGKINTFANQTLPQAVIVSLRKDRPVNLVSAFEKPVQSREGFVTKSIERLSKEFINVGKFTEKPVKTIYLTMDEQTVLENLDAVQTHSLDELVEELVSRISL